MKSNLKVPLVLRVLLGLVFALGMGIVQRTHATILWTGPNTNFTQSAASLTDELIVGEVSLTRAYSQWLYNPDAGDQGPAPGTPTDTEWAFGTLDNYQGLSYQSFYSLRDGDLSTLLPNNPMVVHLINEDIYLSLTFTVWPQHGGFFAYTRSTPQVVITNLINNTVFAAPVTNLNIGAKTFFTGSAVTNVSFYVNSNYFGAAKSAPFIIPTGNLAVGSYAFSAIATSSSLSATSAVVNISVITPLAVTLSSPILTNGLFAFNYSANPGLNYVVQSSSNLVNWQALATNVAASNPVFFMDNNFFPNAARFYRVGRLPNP